MTKSHAIYVECLHMKHVFPSILDNERLLYIYNSSYFEPEYGFLFGVVYLVEHIDIAQHVDVNNVLSGMRVIQACRLCNCHAA